MKIFITGASGFVGGAAARRLSAEYSVTAMSRSTKSDAVIEKLSAQPIRCDLENVDSSHMAGVEVVIHAAAYVEDWGPKDIWDRINVEGTKRLLKAAKEAGVKRFIYIGSEAAVVRGQNIRNADESLPLAIDSPYPYCRTKALAEKEVRAANDSGSGFETIVLRPRFIWGPGDQTLLPAIQAMATKGQWMWLGHGNCVTSTVHIDNLVQAIVLALKNGHPGEAYFIVDDGQRTMHEMITGMAHAVGVALPNRSIPQWAGDAVGVILEFTWRTFSLKGAPPLTRHAAMVMSRDCTLSGEKAKAELGFIPKVTVEEGLARLRSN